MPTFTPHAQLLQSLADMFVYALNENRYAIVRKKPLP